MYRSFVILRSSTSSSTATTSWSCIAGPFQMRRAIASSFGRFKSTSAASGTSTATSGGGVETVSSTADPTPERSFRKEIEEIVVNRIMTSSSSSGLADSNRASATTTTTTTTTAAASLQQATVVPMPAGGYRNNGEFDGQLEKPTSIIKEQDSQSLEFEKGTFESLKQKNDFYKRPGFDRLVSTQLMNDVWLVGVIDGHGQSPICAEYLAESFPVVIRLLLERQKPINSEHHQHHHHHHLQLPHWNKQKSELPLGKDGEKIPGVSLSNYYCEILQEAFKICSREWDTSPQIKSHEHYRNSGAVALLALVSTSAQQIYMASAGDCRALVSQTTGRGYRFVHTAHRTDNVKERLRIVQQGGRIRNIHGVLRVNGSLIPTRVFGDVGLKIDFFGRLRPFLDPNPEIATVEVPKSKRNSSSKYAFSVLASDGLWDSISTESVVEICTEALARNKTAEEIAQMLGSAAMQSTDDDVSIVVLVW